jgi:hypothetical protein
MRSSSMPCCEGAWARNGLRGNLGVGVGRPTNPEVSTQFPAIFSNNWIHVYRRQQSM